MYILLSLSQNIGTKFSLNMKSQYCRVRTLLIRSRLGAKEGWPSLHVSTWFKKKHKKKVIYAYYQCQSILGYITSS